MHDTHKTQKTANTTQNKRRTDEKGKTRQSRHDMPVGKFQRMEHCPWRDPSFFAEEDNNCLLGKSWKKLERQLQSEWPTEYYANLMEVTGSVSKWLEGSDRIRLEMQAQQTYFSGSILFLFPFFWNQHIINSTLNRKKIGDHFKPHDIVWWLWLVIILDFFPVGPTWQDMPKGIKSKYKVLL